MHVIALAPGLNTGGYARYDDGALQGIWDSNAAVPPKRLRRGACFF